MASSCKKYPMKFTYGFPDNEEAIKSKSEDVFDLHLPTGSQLMKNNAEKDDEMISLCESNANIHVWLDEIAQTPYLISGFNEVGCIFFFYSCNLFLFTVYSIIDSVGCRTFS